MKRILKVNHLEKYYGKDSILTKAIDDISFEVNEGEFVAIMGASGSGKTTLLNCISTIDTPTGGEIILDGEDMARVLESNLAKFRRKNLGFIFQEYNLLDTLTIEENIALALTINDIPEKEIDKKVIQVTKKLGIENILSKYPYEVSGGQKQRCASARAIINHPKLILADEPTGALDSKSSKTVLKTLKYLNEEEKVTIFMVTHDPFAASYVSRILFLKDGKIFTEIIRGDKNRKEFFNEILDVNAIFGGGNND